jgi:very-short-patch-repair endonuclease
MTGQMDSVLTSNKSEKDHWYDAPWEKWFHDRLEADGYEVDPQVGVSNWRIDLGVKHKDYPAGYICGIELDGPDHLKLSARDRDIERQSILESKGWTIFRVWSMDFFSDMEGEYNIIKKAIKSTLKKKISEMKNLPNEVNKISENPLRQDVESDGEKIEYLSTASASDILGM